MKSPLFAALPRLRRMIFAVLSVGTLAAALFIVLSATPEKARGQGFPPEQDCLPEPLGTGTPLTVTFNQIGFAWAYHCDVNHRWMRFGAVGLWSEVTDAHLAQARAAVIARDIAKFRQYWGTISCSVARPECCAIADVNCRYHVLQPLIVKIPWPLEFPPSGLVTTDTKIYTVNSSSDFTIISPVGTIALGVPCDTAQGISGKPQRLFVVPSKHPSIKWSGDKRLRVYARCE